MEVLNETWSRDQRYVYCHSRKIRGADPASFQALNILYAKDKNRCYCGGQVIKDADPATFQARDSGSYVTTIHNAFGDLYMTFDNRDGYASDANRVFHLEMSKASLVQKADANSFQVLSLGYARDAGHVFFGRTCLVGADPNSFVVIPPLWGKDKKRVYYGTQKLAGAVSDRFVVLSSADYLSSDGVHFYGRWKEVPYQEAYPHGSSIPGYPLRTAKNAAQIQDYLRRGATPHDSSALRRANHRGDVESVKLILDAGCDMKIIDASVLNSCLTELRGNNALEIARLLVAAGADVNHRLVYNPAYHGKNIRNIAIHSALEHAKHIRNQELVDYLVSQGAY